MESSDKDPAQQPAAHKTPQTEAPLTNASLPTPLVSGFDSQHVAMMALLLRAIGTGGKLQEETLSTIHVPKIRSHLAQGFELQANMLGLFFKQLCDHWNYAYDPFIDVCEAWLDEQMKLMETFREAGIRDPKEIKTKDLPKGMGLN